MVLKHDAQGFLAGDPVDIGVVIADLGGIKSDVRAIRKALLGAGDVRSISAAAAPGRGRNTSPPSARESGFSAAHGGAAASSSQSSAGRSGVALPAGRSGGATSTAGYASAPLRNSASRVASTTVAAAPALRDGRGRFVKSGVSAKTDGRAGALDSGFREDGALRSMADRIVGAVRDAGSSAEEVDPAIKAFNEVAQPMARGYSLLVGGDGSKRQEGWLRRIHTSVAGLRKEEGLFNKVASKRLKAIEEKPVAEAGGNGGLFASLLMALRGIGPAIMAAMAGLIGKLGGGLGGLAKGAGGLLKGGLKRVPLLGSLLSIFGAASDISGSEGDESLSRREKDQRAGKAVGGAAGSIGGMMAGAAAGAFLGPVGAIIGGAVGAFLGDQAGQIIGDKVGGWANDLRAADIPGKIGAAWDATTGFVASAWGTALEGMGKSWNAVVHCRIGSSESHDGGADAAQGVHCRIGSSEKWRAPGVQGHWVHCRIGSSEN